MISYKEKGAGSLPLHSRSERLMGTTITISLVGEQADCLLQGAFDLLKELEYRFNANSQESELMKSTTKLESHLLRFILTCLN